LGKRTHAFIAAQKATADIRSFGTPEGAFEINDTVHTDYGKTSIDSINMLPGRAVVEGVLSGDHGQIRYTLTFTAITDRHLRFEIRCPDALEISRIVLRIASVPEEAFFGFGQQLTYFNQKGNMLPILVQEHGVGRGEPIVTELMRTRHMWPRICSPVRLERWR
jgi:sulfoquinovosidase